MCVQRIRSVFELDFSRYQGRYHMEFINDDTIAVVWRPFASHIEKLRRGKHVHVATIGDVCILPKSTILFSHVVACTAMFCARVAPHSLDPLMEARVFNRCVFKCLPFDVYCYLFTLGIRYLLYALYYWLLSVYSLLFTMCYLLSTVICVPLLNAIRCMLCTVICLYSQFIIHCWLFSVAACCLLYP